MRISDWSSDVFSSDLRIRSARGVDKKRAAELVGEARPVAARYAGDAFVQRAMAEIEYDAENDAEAEAAADRALALDPGLVPAMLYTGRVLARRAAKNDRADDWKAARSWFIRSEEHTSELQSLMSSSYA